MKIEIKELNIAEAEKFSKSLVDFNPERCLACGNETGIVQRFFLLNVSAVEKFHEQIKRTLIDKFGLSYYALCEENDNVITTAKCPECDGEKMEWDY